jgi:hypothetical protein
MLPLGELHVKHAEQRGIWVPTQHLLWDQNQGTIVYLCNFGTDRIENVSSNSSSNVASRGRRFDRVQNISLLLFRVITKQCLMFTEMLLSNESAYCNAVHIH